MSDSEDKSNGTRSTHRRGGVGGSSSPGSRAGALSPTSSLLLSHKGNVLSSSGVLPDVSIDHAAEVRRVVLMCDTV